VRQLCKFIIHIPSGLPLFFFIFSLPTSFSFSFPLLSSFGLLLCLISSCPSFLRGCLRRLLREIRALGLFGPRVPQADAERPDRPDDPGSGGASAVLVSTSTPILRGDRGDGARQQDSKSLSPANRNASVGSGSPTEQIPPSAGSPHPLDQSAKAWASRENDETQLHSKSVRASPEHHESDTASTHHDAEQLKAEVHAEKSRRERADRSLKETEKRINASRDAYNAELRSRESALVDASLKRQREGLETRASFMTAETASKSSSHSGSSAKSGADLSRQLKRELITFTGVAAETTPEHLRRDSAGSPSMNVSDGVSFNTPHRDSGYIADVPSSSESLQPILKPTKGRTATPHPNATEIKASSENLLSPSDVKHRTRLVREKEKYRSQAIGISETPLRPQPPSGSMYLTPEGIANLSPESQRELAALQEVQRETAAANERAAKRANRSMLI